MSMRWEDEQQAFWDWITRPQDLRESSADITRMFAPHRELSQVEALGIYNNAYHQRLINISSELYPILYHTLGEEVYARLWLAYLAEHPPRPGPMGLLGEDLHAFARQHPQFGRLPAMLDIIELETRLITLFDRADQSIFTRADLQQLPAEQWPATRWPARDDWALMRSDFDLEGYWAAMQQYLASGEAQPGEVPFGVERVTQEQRVTQKRRVNQDTDVEGNFYLIRRVQHRMQFQRINAPMHCFLSAIGAGDSFADICSRLAHQFPDQDIASLSLSLLLKTVDLELLCR
ncbi:MAG: putative DNA-binding domain-containing protein [Pseudohongiella sp.]|uniref:HvfC/BufC family peptide modification chaperone n=1 Tax=Pseudohongiella sp. TaxID=1979412 RepID=UPI0034A03235